MPGPPSARASRRAVLAACRASRFVVRGGALRARHQRAGRGRPGRACPSVSTAARSRPPSRPRFLRNWISLGASSAGRSRSRTGVPTRVVGTQGAGEDRRRQARDVTGGQQRTAADHRGAVGPHEELGVVGQAQLLEPGRAQGRSLGLGAAGACSWSRPPTTNIAASMGRATRRTRVMRPPRGRSGSWTCSYRSWCARIRGFEGQAMATPLSVARVVAGA